MVLAAGTPGYFSIVTRRVVIEKREGETPLTALESYRRRAGIARSVPMTYAGRLDPMASGTLLVLVGDECKRKSAYSTLDKEYEFEILLGLASDTGDILGLSEACIVLPPAQEHEVRSAIQAVKGEWEMPYPAYSSKPVSGKPLFQHARDGTLGSVVTPSRLVRIHDIGLLSVSDITGEDALRALEERLGALTIDPDDENPYKDFRRDEIVERWRSVVTARTVYRVVRIHAIVSSGTYIRALAPRIAGSLGTCGLAYSIRRTRIGRYLRLPYGGVWLSSYR